MKIICLKSVHSFCVTKSNFTDKEEEIYSLFTEDWLSIHNSILDIKYGQKFLKSPPNCTDLENKQVLSNQKLSYHN